MTRLLVVAFFSAAVLGCDDSPVVVTPTPLEPLPPYPATSVRIWGTAIEHTPSGQAPLAGLRFDVLLTYDPWADGPPLEITSDREGRFQFDASRDGLVALVVPGDTGYHAPCPAGFQRVTDHQTIQLHVVSAARLASDGRPSSLPSTDTWLSGVVYQVESKDQGWWDFIPTLSGATVELATDGDGLLKSTTLSDNDGRFFLCTNPPGVSTDRLSLSARKTGYEPDSVVSVTQGSGHDLFLVRH